MMAVVAFLVGVFVSSFLGYWFHRGFHVRGFPGFKGHMTHHWTLYPPWKFTAEKYLRPPFWQSGTFLFLPPTLAVIILTLALHIPLPHRLSFIAGLLVYALANDWAHDRLHLKDCKWATLKALHLQHHRNNKTNFGILSFFWDRVFRSYKEVEKPTYNRMY